jgi:hypothetical protein
LPTEQQESIGEMMLTSDGSVITQSEFRQRLLELPGWEQYTALLTFSSAASASRPPPPRAPAEVTGPGQAAGEDITIVIGINDYMRGPW